MIFIAHRGNTNGPSSKKENSLPYIVSAISNGFDVEIDLWLKQERKWEFFVENSSLAL